MIIMIFRPSRCCCLGPGEQASLGTSLAKLPLAFVQGVLGGLDVLGGTCVCSWENPPRFRR